MSSAIKMQEMIARREKAEKKAGHSKLGTAPKPDEARSFETVENIPTHSEIEDLKNQASTVEQEEKPILRRKKPAPRVQKNLRILKSDSQRMAKISKRDDISQAMLINAMLDAYENQAKSED